MFRQLTIPDTQRARWINELLIMHSRLFLCFYLPLDGQPALPPRFRGLAFMFCPILVGRVYMLPRFCAFAFMFCPILDGRVYMLPRFCGLAFMFCLMPSGRAYMFPRFVGDPPAFCPAFIGRMLLVVPPRFIEFPMFCPALDRAPMLPPRFVAAPCPVFRIGCCCLISISLYTSFRFLDDSILLRYMI